MRSSRKLKTVERWIAKHPELVDEHWIEADGYGEADGQGGFSYWIYLNKGYINEACEVHCIHECTAQAVMEMTECIKPCHCEDCTPVWEA